MRYRLPCNYHKDIYLITFLLASYFSRSSPDFLITQLLFSITIFFQQSYSSRPMFVAFVFVHILHLLYDVQPFLQCVVSSTRGKILVNITKTPLFYFSLSSSLSQLPRCKELVAIHQSPVRYLGHNEYEYFRSHVHAPFPFGFQNLHYYIHFRIRPIHILKLNSDICVRINDILNSSSNSIIMFNYIIYLLKVFHHIIH